MLRATLPCQRETLSPEAFARNHMRMNTATMINSVPRSDVCPYCGQPVTRAQLNEIRARVRAEEQARLKVLERQLREQAAAAAKAETAKLNRQAAELAAREKALASRQKQVEAVAKVRYDEGYRKARGEAVRVQQQLQKQVDDFPRWHGQSGGSSGASRVRTRLGVSQVVSPSSALSSPLRRLRSWPASWRATRKLMNIRTAG